MFSTRVPILLFMAALACGCSTVPAARTAATGDTPHGIVLIVGDGMGSAHFTLAGILRGEDYRIGGLERTGLVTTASANSLVTDSAAAATAYATGIKTNDGSVGVDPSGAPRPTVLEIAVQRGLATGLVTTAPFGDATPAAFAAHAANRRDFAAISTQMLASGADILASTGLERFGTDTVPPLEQLAADSGYELVRSGAAVRTAGDGPVLAVLPSGMLDSGSPDIPLHELTLWALARLSSGAGGFFLLVEHEGTDTASHRNDSTALGESLVALDETVGAVTDFARERGDILVIVVGDHETGGMQVGGTRDVPEAIWRDNYHSGEAVPIFSEGPGSKAFTGFIDNTDVGKALLALVGRMGS